MIETETEPTTQTPPEATALADVSCPVAQDTKQLADEIRAAVEGAKTMALATQQAAELAIRSASRAGDLLNQAKLKVGHGNWAAWLKEHVPDLSRSQACRWMRLARNLPKLANFKEVKSLTAAYTAVGIFPEKVAAKNKPVGPASTKAATGVRIQPRRDNTRESKKSATKDPRRPASEPTEPTDRGTDHDPAPKHAVAPPSGPATEADLIAFSREFRRVLAELRDPDGIRLSPECLRELRDTHSKLARFIEVMGAAPA